MGGECWLFELEFERWCATRGRNAKEGDFFLNFFNGPFIFLFTKPRTHKEKTITPRTTEAKAPRFVHIAIELSVFLL